MHRETLDKKAWASVPLSDMGRAAHALAVQKGFYDCVSCDGTGRDATLARDGLVGICQACKGANTTSHNVNELLMLVVTELAEATEHYRNGNFGRPLSDVFAVADESGTTKPDGFAIEVADAIIRLFDLCGHLGIDVVDAIATKMVFNEGRSHRHGGKKV